MTAAKVFLVEDHPITRQGLEQLIEIQPDMTVCGWAEDARTVTVGVESTRPQLVIMDLSLRGSDGLEVMKRILIRQPRLKVLILSMHDESLYARRALRAGACGYIMKSENPEKLLAAMRRVLEGEIYISEQESGRILGNVAHNSESAGESLVECLSDRELEVFRWVGQGSSVRETADSLHVSIKTIETHCARIKAKLNIATHRELSRQAVLWLAQENR